MVRWTRIRHRAALIALVIGLSLSLGTAGVAGAIGEVPSASLSQETTTAQASGDASVEFTGCSAAQVSGDVDRVMADTSFYGADGIGGNTLGFDSVDGSMTIEVPGDGIAGESLDSVTLYRGGEAVVEKENPNKESCWNEIRPEEPTISFVGQERTDEGYEATYEYTNPNDEALYVNNEFDADVSGETPEEFQSGTHQFTVGWSPESATEVLTWNAHLGTFGYDTAEASSTAPETTATTTGQTTGAASAGPGATQPTQTMTPDESTTDENTPDETTSDESASEDGSNGTPSVEFTGCSAARISGEADRVMADTSFYGADGIGGNTFGPESVSGTTTIEVPGDGITGESLDSVTLFRDGEAVVEKENPNKESCWNEIRPGKVDVSFVGAERTGDGSYEMTYEYTNPNDQAMFVNSDFDADVSGGTPEEFRPGTHQFTVKWSPDDDEQLTWNVHLGTFGYDTVQVSGSVPTGTGDDGSSDDDDGGARTDGGSDSDGADSNASGSTGDGSGDAGSDGSSSNAGAGNDGTTTTTDEAAQGSSGTDGSDADGGDTPTPTATDTTAANATDSAMSGGADGVETEITGGVESSGQPGMGMAAALLALVGGTLVALRRH